MPIPEKQLEAWANQGAVVLSKQTHESIRVALESEISLIKEKKYRIYLQGSYKNSTNIRGDSDVDVVVELQSAFSPDISLLSSVEKANYGLHYPNVADYGWKAFREDVIQSLKKYYGSGMVCSGNKSIKVIASSGRLSADIIPCLQHRKYTKFIDAKDNAFTGGIKFYTSKENRAIVNFPELHYQFGTEKNGQLKTNGWFKPTVRVFKNARNKMIENHLIPEENACSYFIENLLFNVPDNLYGESYEKTFYNIVTWLIDSDLSRCICQNQQNQLFGAGPEQWEMEKALYFIDGLKNLWNRWR